MERQQGFFGIKWRFFTPVGRVTVPAGRTGVVLSLSFIEADTVIGPTLIQHINKIAPP
jgi:hypothetical protein